MEDVSPSYPLDTASYQVMQRMPLKASIRKHFRHFKYNHRLTTNQSNTATVQASKDKSSAVTQEPVCNKAKSMMAQHQPPMSPTIPSTHSVGIQTEIDVNTERQYEPMKNLFTSDYIKSAKNLNFRLNPRPNILSHPSHPLPPIPIIAATRISEGLKWAMLSSALDMGYRAMTCKERKILGEAIAKRESYLAGYSCPTGTHNTIRHLYYTYETARRKGTCVHQTFINKCNQGRKSFVTRICDAFPGHLHRSRALQHQRGRVQPRGEDG